MTKAGHVGLVYRLRGVDVDGLTQRNAGLSRTVWRQRFDSWTSGAGLSMLIKRTVDPFVAPLCAEPVAQEALCRRTAYLNARRPELYQLAQYSVLLAKARHRAGEHPTPRALARAARSLSPVALDPSLAESAGNRLDDAIDEALHQAESFETQLADFGLSRLGPPDAFQFFRQLVNYDLAVSSAAPPTTPETWLITSSPTRRSIATEII